MGMKSEMDEDDGEDDDGCGEQEATRVYSQG